MPEKPEVITVVNNLKNRIIGKKIVGCNIYWDNIIAYPTTNEFKKEIINQKINDITTRGKFIVISLDDYSLLIHLRMEGKFFFRTKNDPIVKHEHVELIFNDNTSFRYHDVRKFGKMYLIPIADTYKVKPLNELGLEYNDKNLTKDYLYNKIHNKNLPIKTVLLDQSIITGIGNIYDDEVLFLSRINPNRKASSITLEECNSIIKNTKKVLDKAITLGGTTIKSFTSSEGVHGLFQNELLVHGKSGKNCPNCGTIIKKTRIGGRGTSYCEKCQKE
ncbi:MAG: DNA-formamidopyrimidine glycosylase [Bacilli bacterium]|nr:DNA-formamidopyrimidine glycosylase [Bacilli bacterium]